MKINDQAQRGLWTEVTNGHYIPIAIEESITSSQFEKLVIQYLQDNNVIPKLSRW
jgi:hypothetical protein